MPEIQLIKLIEDAMDLHGADGLWNGDGPCGCGRGDLSPGNCMGVGCTLAKSKIATEDDVDDCIEVGDTVWSPIQIRATSLANEAQAAPVQRVVGRCLLKRGNRYQFPDKSGFLVTFVALPGHLEHDGGLPGVGIQLIGRSRKRVFYPFKSEAEFWSYSIFKYAVDAPNPKADVAPASGAHVQRVVGPALGAK